MDNSDSALRNPHSTLRRGVSLLEVLMSIFIITIGVLGVAALLPLASHLANRGTTADRAAVAGREAMHQIPIRGMNNPTNWLGSDGTTAFSVDPTLGSGSPLDPSGARAYCLDPRGIAHGVTGVFPNGATANMQRITLRPQAGADLSALTATQKLALADELCRLQDDLNFEIPDDATLPPVNNTFKHDAGTPTPADDTVAVKRFSDGDFSWLATLTRDGTGDRYNLSVVIFYRRNPPVVEPAPTAVTFYSGGYGGGDVALTGPAAANAETGQWVLLSSGNLFRWYRVVNSAEYVAGNAREVTLAGPDWDASLTTQATIIPGVIAVLVRTIRLETSTLW